MDYNKINYGPNKEISLSKLRNLLRDLGIRSVKSELEYSLLEIMHTMEQDTYGKPDQIYVSPQTYESLSEILSKDKVG